MEGESGRRPVDGKSLFELLMCYMSYEEEDTPVAGTVLAGRQRAMSATGVQPTLGRSGWHMLGNVTWEVPSAFTIARSFLA